MSMDQATVTLPYLTFKEMEKKSVDLERQVIELQAKTRTSTLDATPHVAEYIAGLLGARICIGFAISKLGAAFTAGWPVDELRMFLNGLALVDNGDPDVQQSVKDFADFALEVDQAEAVRRARKLAPPDPPEVVRQKQLADREAALMAARELIRVEEALGELKEFEKAQPTSTDS